MTSSLHMGLEEALSVAVREGGYDRFAEDLSAMLVARSGEGPVFLGRRHLDDGEAILWAIVVCLFGGYERSTRTGWVEEPMEAADWLDSLAAGR